MKSDEKDIIRTIAEAVLTLPPEKREYIIGFAEGVLAMRAEQASA